MRIGILPFFVLGCLVVFYWARRYFGLATGVIATLLFTLIPTVLAHAGLATTDMGLAACLGAAFLAMLVWAEEPGPRHGVDLRILHGAGLALQVHHAGILSRRCGHRPRLLPGGGASGHANISSSW